MHDYSMPRGVIADTSPSSSLSSPPFGFFLIRIITSLVITLLITSIKFVDKVLILYSEKNMYEQSIFFLVFLV